MCPPTNHTCKLQSENLYDKLLGSIDKSFNAIEAMKHMSGAVEMNCKENVECLWTGNSRADSPDERNSLSSTWHIYDNPFGKYCDVSEINSRGPPLFALRFPELFVF